VTHAASDFQKRRESVHGGSKENIHVFHCFGNHFRHESLGRASESKKAEGMGMYHSALRFDVTVDAGAAEASGEEVLVVIRGVGDEFSR
jgi:hypothetical protein